MGGGETLSVAHCAPQQVPFYFLNNSGAMACTVIMSREDYDSKMRNHATTKQFQNKERSYFEDSEENQRSAKQYGETRRLPTTHWTLRFIHQDLVSLRDVLYYNIVGRTKSVVSVDLRVVYPGTTGHQKDMLFTEL